mmetsp:Transcript_18945/g.64513  ORF Transcript_18945/g.64513 Transcript_18945/m.64513 type:complete len:252 (-) Transcript_18945:123-878(-)|eukprot:CAMPEP_0183801262 /NCGR_PEP_ID=MMETSP0803_2-20130417/27291_1 /TAXON_ID=195967 /ORGANISM="Crustomastix stigmata, Strain CCMP3273" /LENGTH=251 /DNA_ID=CAMNT_0026045981 /DNA_START=47 /DNA_END=802 /DNA_ORIENTATION=+
MADERTKLLYQARMAENAERYDEMMGFMSEVVKLGAPLSVEERNLLSVSFKNGVGNLRAANRVVEATIQKEQAASEDFKVELAVAYKKKIEQELEVMCNRVIALLEDFLLASSDGSQKEEEVFYQKMMGDYLRYLAEFKRDDRSVAMRTKEAYEKAKATADQYLEKTNPILLGLALNFSVFHYEILNEKTTACDVAKDAFDQAISQLDNLEEANYKDATLIMQLLRDNLTLWTSAESGADAPADGLEVEDA